MAYISFLLVSHQPQKKSPVKPLPFKANIRPQLFLPPTGNRLQVPLVTSELGGWSWGWPTLGKNGWPTGPRCGFLLAIDSAKKANGREWN